MKNIAIGVRGVTRTYPNGKRALDGLDLEVGEGARFALLGPNGAGKSTLIKLLATLGAPDGGEIRLGGERLGNSSSRARERIAVALQEVQLDPEASAREQLRFQGRLFGLPRKAAEERADELIGRFGLREEEGKKAKELSGGNKRRLHIALSLVHRPSLLILDEPTTGMDPEIRAAFWAELRRLNEEEGVTVFFSTQYLEEAERHADELAVLDRGRIAYRGSTAAFIAAQASGGTEAAEAADLESSYLKFLEATHG